MRIDDLQKSSNESGRTKSHTRPAGQDERQRVVESARLHRWTVGLGKRRNNHGCKHRFPCRNAHMYSNAAAFQHTYKARRNEVVNHMYCVDCRSKTRLLVRSSLQCLA